MSRFKNPTKRKRRRKIERADFGRANIMKITYNDQITGKT